MRKNNILGADVDLDKLAETTKNYTGADIASVCRSACSWALFQGSDEFPGDQSASKPSGDQMDKMVAEGKKKHGHGF